MNSNFSDRSKSADVNRDRVFDDLRRRLHQETQCRRVADLLESVNAMERARNVPDQFDLRFEEFVYRAEDYMPAVRPFFPALVTFLSSHEVADGMECRNIDGSAQPHAAVRVA